MATFDTSRLLGVSVGAGQAGTDASATASTTAAVTLKMELLPRSGVLRAGRENPGHGVADSEGGGAAALIIVAVGESVQQHRAGKDDSETASPRSAAWIGGEPEAWYRAP